MENLLLKLIKKNGRVIVLEAHSGLSAKVVENSGFDAIWESSLTDSGVKAQPDIELVSGDSRLRTIAEIREASKLPIIVDWDTGGQIDHFPFWVERLERAGVSAIIIEDKAFPKRNSLDKTAKHQLEDIDKFCTKIEAGKTKAKDILIFARLESLIAQHSVFEALVRAEAFIKAGADGIMIHSKTDVSDVEIFEFAKRFRVQFPNVILICVPTAYNHVYDKKLAEAGFNIIIHANQLLRASLKAMRKVAKMIKENGRSQEADKEIASVKDIFTMSGYRDLFKL